MRSGASVRVILPYTKLDDQVVGAIVDSGYEPELCDVSASDESYWDLLHGLWAGKEDFCIVEHDIKVNDDTLHLMRQCSSLWCACSYRYLRGKHVGLGCARFRKELMVLYPEAMNVIAEWTHPSHAAKHWCTLDHYLHCFLDNKDVLLHRHAEVEHLGSIKPAHGCVP